MVFDRKTAKGSIQNKDQSDPELSSAFNEGHKAQAELAQIKNKHEIDKLKTERGLIGVLFGNWKNVPMFIALLSVLFGISTFYVFMSNAADDDKTMQFWSESAKVALAFAGAALGYIFGRGSNSNDNP